MAKLKVRWTQSATVQFGRMLTFYNVRNGNSRYSRTIVKMVSESLKLIAKFPQMYRAVDAEEIVMSECFIATTSWYITKFAKLKSSLKQFLTLAKIRQHFLSDS